MAEGYLARSATNTDGMSYEAMLYCKTNIAGYFFDGFISTKISHSLEITENPVETGAAIVDHAYVKPSEVTMQIKMSDVHKSLISGQFEGGWSRSIKAYDVLRKIQTDRIPVSVLSPVALFDNMLVKSIEVDCDSNTYTGLSASVTLVEIPIARVKTVAISAASQTTLETEMGKISAVNTSSSENSSILYTLTGELVSSTKTKDTTQSTSDASAFSGGRLTAGGGRS